LAATASCLVVTTSVMRRRRRTSRGRSFLLARRLGADHHQIEVVGHGCAGTRTPREAPPTRPTPRVTLHAVEAIGIAQVNVGVPRLLAHRDGERVYSAIAKQPVAPGTVLWLSSGNLAGDAQADLSVHGGPDKAVYAYPSEHLPVWAEELGAPLGDAAFGENLSTRGVLESDVRIGDRHLDDRARVEALARHEALAAEWREPLRERLASGGAGGG
jgi:hypothetical protein